MPGCRALAWGLVAACCCAGVGVAGEARDEFESWENFPSRPAVARGPSGIPAAVRGHDPPPEAPPIFVPQPLSPPPQPLPAPPREIVDAAVNAASFHASPRHERAPATTAYAASPSDSPTLETSAPAPVVADRFEGPAAAATIDEPVAAAEPRRPPTAHAADRPGGTDASAARRRLGPPTTAGRSAGQRAPRPLADFSWSSVSSDSAATVGASLAIVLGLVFLLAWVWRRAAPASTRALPSEAVGVIGRLPLANRQMAQLIKIGGKLVLVCVTPEGAKPLTEITDPEEVARLLGLLEQTNPHSASAAFRDVFDQLAREPAAPGFLGDEATLVDRQKLADAYANTPGGRAHA